MFALPRLERLATPGVVAPRFAAERASDRGKPPAWARTCVLRIGPLRHWREQEVKGGPRGQAAWRDVNRTP